MKLVHTSQLPEIGTSHDESIKKKVFIKKGEVPQLMMFGSATFTPGQEVETHKHDTMYEVFYIQTGKAEFIINDKKMIVVAGDCITIEQGEYHSMSNPFSDNVTWTYFGIATDK
ncbi:cupin domain-containing protein [Polaribacter sargassicola]|uniref:cupin domain-containing protein n=1 Tax=Polaribacter sargassicola TaxID=2836891 RepID=UPI001F38195F|nr:cupin domain-containing protein [Polaribacter sp. DS7-9]MCG1037021.1 cupin domain-containing protein [Polaribacter sp. DS7-9]